jgi:hypothetical protein
MPAPNSEFAGKCALRAANPIFKAFGPSRQPSTDFEILDARGGSD